MTKTYIGVDLGGTKISAAKIDKSSILKKEYHFLPKDNGDENVVINIIIDTIKTLMDDTVQAIGIGLPSIVDAKQGIVYSVKNIPSWKEVRLVEHLHKYFDIPIYLNNDANCYALGEAYFGKAIGCDFFVGLTIGTGLGAGIIYNKQLINGSHGASGEFGIMPYMGKTLEDYCSGQFFESEYGKSGQELFELAKRDDPFAKNAFNDFGVHLGNAIKIIISAIDPEKITIGGSVAKSNKFYKKMMWETIKGFQYQKNIDDIEIAFSNNNNMGVLGAASLCFNSKMVNS